MRRTRIQAGFTLLEVMMAFAILAVVTGSMAAIIHENMGIAADAIDQREMREVADTLFGKFIFEQTKHSNGDEGGVDVEYGRWAGLPEKRAERYALYRWRLEKEEQIAAGTSDSADDAEGIFGDDNDEDESSGEEEASKGNIRLIKFTLKVFRENESEEPIIVLSRYLPPPEFEDGAGGK